MKAILVLGLATTVMVLLTEVMGYSPGQDTVNNPGDVEDVRDFNEVGEQFTGMLGSVVNDISSFQTDPSSERVEERLSRSVAGAQSMGNSFEDFSDLFREKLDSLTRVFRRSD